MPAAPILKTELTPTLSINGSNRRQPIFQAPRNSTVNESVCDDSIISAARTTIGNSNSYQNSPFSKRLNFDETMHDVENVTLALSKTAVEDFTVHFLTKKVFIKKKYSVIGFSFLYNQK